jgi:hypothetical protein
MKVGIFSSGEGAGGTEKIAIYLAEFLKRKHDVDILLWKKWENRCFHTNVPLKKYEKALQFKKEKIKVILAGRVGEIDYYKFLKEQFPFVGFHINVSEEELVKFIAELQIIQLYQSKEHYGLLCQRQNHAERPSWSLRLRCSEPMTDGENGYLFDPDYSNFKGKFYEALHNDVGKKRENSSKKYMT